MNKRKLSRTESGRNIFGNLIISIAALLLIVAGYLLMYVRYDIVYMLGNGFIIACGVVVVGLAINIVLCLVFLNKYK